MFTILKPTIIADLKKPTQKLLKKQRKSSFDPATNSLINLQVQKQIS